jgi:hypothetical protein
MEGNRLDTHQKAVQVNLDNSKYGTFAEIGAGQEVARWFFRVGGGVPQRPPSRRLSQINRGGSDMGRRRAAQRGTFDLPAASPGLRPGEVRRSPLRPAGRCDAAMAPGSACVPTILL